MINYLKIKKDNIFCVFILWIWAQTILLQYIRAVIIRFPIIGSYADIFLTVIFFILLFLSFSFFKFNKKDILFLLFIIFVFIFEWLIYEKNREFLNEYMIKFIFKVLPLYIVGVSFGKYKYKEEIIQKMYYISILTLLLSIVYKIYFIAPMNDIVSKYQGNMDQAYKILPHCCLIAYYTFKKFNLFNVLYSFIGCGYLLMLGTRGAVLIYLALFIILFIRKNNCVIGFIKLGSILSIFLLFFNSSLYKKLLIKMYEISKLFGLSVRIFDKLLTNEATVSTGRNVIAEKILIELEDNMILGCGICSDRIITGIYAHNIILELWIEFGIIIGTIITIIIIIIMFRGYMSAMKDVEKGFILILIFSSFFKLILSGSYLDEKLLFFLLGLCISSIRKINKKKVNKI